MSGLNAEKAEGLKYSYWDDVCAEIDKKIEKELNKLITCSAEDLSRIQERIKTFAEIKRLPQQVIDERKPKED